MSAPESFGPLFLAHEMFGVTICEETSLGSTDPDSPEPPSADPICCLWDNADGPPPPAHIALGRLFVASPEMLAALKLVQAWRGFPGETSLDVFERIAAWFQKETGYLRPGRDEPASVNTPDGARGRAWNIWCEKKTAEVDAAIAGAIEKAEAP